MSKVSSINSIDPGTTPIIDEIVENLETQLVRGIEQVYQQSSRSFSNEIQYIPFIFSVLYNHDKNSEILTEDLMANVHEKATWLVDQANNIFAGTTSNSAYTGDGNWQSINNNPDHQVTSNVRFFLPYKIPKEFLYPFYPCNVAPGISGADKLFVDFSSMESFRNSFSDGLSNIPDTDGLSYTSSYTYEDIRDKRNYVKDLYSQSLLNNNSAIRSIDEDLEEEKEILRLMEEDYFFFFASSRPGMIFVRRFDNDDGYIPNFQDNIQSYQMNAIRAINNGALPVNRGVNDNTASGTLFENFGNQSQPSSGLFSNLPFIKVNTTTKEPRNSNGFLGVAVLGATLENSIYASGGYNIISINSARGSNVSLNDFKSQTYSVFLHEFFHTLGYGHSRNGYSITGRILFEETIELQCYKREGAYYRTQNSHYDRFYMPFEPPFIYYDPFNSDHDLTDVSTLPDLATINPNEKKYVETVINEIIPNATNNFQTKIGFSFTDSWYGNGLIIKEVYKSGSSGPAHSETEISTQSRRLGYAELFGMVTHLPTFWGGSYTENADGTKSLLINATNEPEPVRQSSQARNFVLPDIGDFYGGGVVAHITDTKIYIVTKRALSSFYGGGLAGTMGPNSTDYSNFTHNLEDGKATTQAWVDETTAAGKDATIHGPYNALNETIEGYSDWYIPTLDLTIAMHDNFTDIDLSSEGIEWFGPTGSDFYTYGTSSGISSYKNIYTGSVIATCSRTGLNLQNSTYRRFKTVRIKDEQAAVFDNWIWNGIPKYLLFREEDIPDPNAEPEVDLNRVGPNITVYNPVCLIDEATGERTKFNWALPASLDWYNPAFPPFPDNTRVEDMFSPDLCPCLYTNQNVDVRDPVDHSITTNYDIKLFNALVDEVTGEEITTTTGIPITSEGSKAITAYIREPDIGPLPRNCGTNPSGANMLPAMFGASIARGNVAANFDEYFGYDQVDSNGNTTTINMVWLKQTGEFIVPNFPVYVGFMPESPLPKFFRFDPSKFIANAQQGAVGGGYFTDQTDHNDPSIYSSWGQQYYTITDKYLRTGSTNVNDPDYNPFLIDINAAGVKSELELSFNEFRTIKDWTDYQIPTRLHATGSTTYTATNPLENFYQRKLPNTANPALDDLPDTIYGPINQNTFSNIMYYETTFTEPILPSPSMMERLNYLGESHAESPASGLLALAKIFTNDLYSLDTSYNNVLPDYQQRVGNTIDQINTYVGVAMDYIESQAILPTEVVEGCIDTDAYNYNPNATFSDGSCIERTYGCTDSASPNYNPDVNTDDGSCEYYSLVFEPIVQIPICPAEIVNACNADASGYTPVDMLNQILQMVGDTNLSLPIHLNYEDSLEIKTMITNAESYYWTNPDKVAHLNTFRFGAGINGCTNELGSIAEGALNLGGGCVNVIDFEKCNYPTVTNYQCDILGEVTSVSSYSANIETSGSVVFSEAGRIPFEELASYFDGYSSLGYTIGVCNENEI